MRDKGRELKAGTCISFHASEGNDAALSQTGERGRSMPRSCPPLPITSPPAPSYFLLFPPSLSIIIILRLPLSPSVPFPSISTFLPSPPSPLPHSFSLPPRYTRSLHLQSNASCPRKTSQGQKLKEIRRSFGLFFMS